MASNSTDTPISENRMKRPLERSESDSSSNSPDAKRPFKVDVKPLETDDSKIPQDPTSQFLFSQLKILNANFVELAKSTNFACEQSEDTMKHYNATNKLVESVNESVLKVIQDNNVLKKENSDLKERLIKLESHQRRENLIFEGISESRGETDFECYQKIANAISYLPDIDPYSVRISRCHRLGPFVRGQTRGIIAHFHWYGDRQHILKCKRFLPYGVAVHEDFPQEIEDRRRVLKPILKAALNSSEYKGKAFLSVDKLIVNRKAYTVEPHNNLDQLPDSLKPEKVAEKSNQETLVFFGQNSHFSNFHPAKFTIDNRQYSCTEQFIQSQKAKLFDDDVAEHRILSTDSPYEMKKIGSTVRNFNFNKWSEEAPKIAKKGLRAKFSQNSHLKERLLSTGDKNLAEATKEKLWGCGVGLYEQGCLDSSRWTRRGIMGDTLISIRDELKS